jgi:hypothetical protein
MVTGYWPAPTFLPSIISVMSAGVPLPFSGSAFPVGVNSNVKT